MRELKKSLSLILAFSIVSACFGTSDIIDLTQVDVAFPLLKYSLLFIIAAFILWASSMLGKGVKARVDFRQILITSTTLIVLPTISIIFTKKTIPTSAITLAFEAVPVFVLVTTCIQKKALPFSQLTIIGLASGIYGSWLCLSVNTCEAIWKINFFEFILLALGVVSAAIGAVNTRQLLKTQPLRYTAALQLFCASILLFFLGCSSGELTKLNLAALNSTEQAIQSISCCLNWTIVFPLYLWLLKKLSPLFVTCTSYFYALFATVILISLGRQEPSARDIIAFLLNCVALKFISGEKLNGEKID